MSGAVSNATAPGGNAPLTTNDGNGVADFAGAAADIAHIYGYTSGGTWSRLNAVSETAGDAVIASGFDLAVAALVRLWNGSNFDRARSLSGSGDGLGVAQSSQPSSVFSFATATAATATLTFAAVAGQSHRLTSVNAAYSSAPVAAGIASIVDNGLTVFQWLGSTAPTGPQMPPGGIKATAVNVAVSVSLASGGAGIVGYVYASKITG